MVAGCGMTCIKYVLFAVNILFFLMGVLAVGLGIYALVDQNNMAALTKIDSDGKLDDFNAVGLLQSGAIVLIVAGSLILILGFLGCCGAVKEIKCLLAVYAAIIIIIFVIQLTAAILAIVFRSRMTEFLKKGLKEGLVKNYDGVITSDNAFSRAFDFGQVYFECCGVDGPDDFANTTWKNNSAAGTYVPPTCCELSDKDAFLDNNVLNLKHTDCPTTAVGDSNPYTNEPCYNKIKDWIEDKAVIIISIAFIILIIEIVAVVFALCLYRDIES